MPRHPRGTQETEADRAAIRKPIPATIAQRGFGVVERAGRPMPPDFELAMSYRPLVLTEEPVYREAYGEGDSAEEIFGGGGGVWFTNRGGVPWR